MSDEGISPSGQPVIVPDYAHDVSMDFIRYELGAALRVAEGWEARLRMPYDVKDRRASVRPIDPATPGELAAMHRAVDVHHPTEVLEGVSDFSLLLARTRHGLFRHGDVFSASVGSSVPVGRTERDPYAPNNAAQPHEHVQFGNGTFDPLLEFAYFTPIAGPMSASLHGLGRFPLYENGKGYRGPIEVSSGLNLALTASSHVTLRAGWSFSYQHYAHWNDVRDPNSGSVTHGMVGGLSLRVADRVSLTLDVRSPISQRTLSDHGDTFEQGTVAQLGLSYVF